MLRRSLLLSLLFTFPALRGAAQQFIGLTSKDYAGIQQVPTNPAYINSAQTGAEVNIFAFSAMAGTNAYAFRKDVLLSGGEMVEDKTFYKDLRKTRKHIWLNTDILGPSFSFNYKQIHNVGLYTRMRQIFRGGNLTETQFKLLGEMTPEYYNVPLDFKKAGFSSQSFAEVGITYGREIRNDYYHIVKAGATLKYLMGFAAASAYTNSTVYVQSGEDTLAQVKGNATALFTYNVNPLDGGSPSFNAGGLFQRAGKGGLGMDLGIQYEYHPDGDPNKSSPYSYSIAASLTDIGGITYMTDTGSGSYSVNIGRENIQGFDTRDGDDVASYMGRLQSDSLISRDNSPKKFRMGLPTAFRVQADYNVTNKMNLMVSFLMNLRGNGGDIYKPGYVGYFNLTPTYSTRRFKLGMPFTFIGYQTVTIGTVLQAGPFYIGSNGVFSTLLSSNVKNADVFMGLNLKFKSNRNGYYY